MFDEYYLLLDDETLTADKNGSAFDRFWMSHTPVVFCMSVTGTISGTSPTLDIKIQGTNDNGSNWVDIVSFPQVTGTTPVKKFVRALCPYAQIRAVADTGGTSPSYGLVQVGIVPAGQYTDPA